MTIIIFFVFVGIVLAISTYTSRRAKGVGGYFVANSSVPWGINGIAFAGGYLSVASFLGICGLIAFFGFDGFLYSIGFLAGWIIALFVIAEPMKRRGTYTFSDALNHTFHHKGIQLAAGISVLVVSLFYLVPQMVGAGVLIEPLLGIPHIWGVLIVGSIVILIVASGGMTSTTYVQFFNGGLLLVFAIVLTAVVLVRGVNTQSLPLEEGSTQIEPYVFQTINAELDGVELTADLPGANIIGKHAILNPYTRQENIAFYRISRLIPVVSQNSGGFISELKGRTVNFDTWAGPEPFFSTEEFDGETYIRIEDWWKLEKGSNGSVYLKETQFRAYLSDGRELINGALAEDHNFLRQMGRVARIEGSDDTTSTGPVGPLRLLSILSNPGTSIIVPRNTSFTSEQGEQVTIYYETTIDGATFMRPGLLFPLEAREGEPGSRTLLNRLNFISLMLALFLGTSALPHILIRYYTVPDADAARKSTIVAIAGIGLFYILTMFLGVGAIANGALNPETSNMSAPLLARSFGETLFAMISGIAFTTVLATVSGLIMAASGAVAHDLIGLFSKREVPDATKVRAGRIAAVFVGIIAIVLGVIFRDMNVSFLVGWAFAVAASANLPSLLAMLFWKKTTAQGIIGSVLTGVVSSVILIMLSPEMWAIYGLDPASAPMPINQPGIISIPLSFIALVAISFLTSKKGQPVPLKA
jgi:cation/acetate symporter